MYPILYSSTETAFNDRGLGPMSDAVSCIVTEERNGSYELTMQYPVNGLHYEDLMERSLILAIPSPYRAPQPFRVYKVEAPMNGIVTVHASHVSYDLSGIPVEPCSITGDAQTILDGLVTHSLVTNPFSVFSNFTTSVAFESTLPSSFRALLGGQEGSLLDHYHGEYLFDRFNVSLLTSRGKDSGVRIAYGKNMTEFKMTSDYTIITGIYPYWTDGEGNIVECSPKIVEVFNSPYYDNVVPVDLSDRFEEEPSQAQLLTMAQQYIAENDLAKPRVTFDVSFIDLASTDEYSAIAPMESVDLCDNVTVVFPMYGVEATAKVVAIETNVLAERYNKVTVGTVQATLADTISSLLNSSGSSGSGSSGPHYIPSGSIDAGSTSTVKNATVPGVTSLFDGVAALVTNDATASASGVTLNINGLGDYPIYNSLDGARVTTTFGANSSYVFIFDSSLDSGNGGWFQYYGYNSNTNTIGYQVRTNSSTRPASDKGYRYRLWFSSMGSDKWVPANLSTSTNATAVRTPNPRPIDPYGDIIYYSTNGTTEANANLGAAAQWTIYTLTLGYSFNTTGAALTMTYPAPVYVKCSPQADGSAIMQGYTQTLPSTEDGYIYIYLGAAYSATAIELRQDHPVFWYKNGAIRHWNHGKGEVVETSVSNVSVSNNSWKSIANLSLSAGTWLVRGNPRFGNGSPNSGTRQMCLDTTANNNTTHGKVVISLASAANDTNVIGMEGSYIFKLSSASTVYLNVLQGQGSSLNVSAELQAVKL